MITTAISIDWSIILILNSRGDKTLFTAMEVTRATREDVPGIMAVLSQNLLSNKSNKDPCILQQSGFLIHGFTAEELIDCMNDAGSIVLVAKTDGMVSGYAIELPCTILPPWLQALKSAPQLHSLLSEPAKVLYHRHIAKLPNYAGVGSPLLQSVISEAKAKDYRYILCQIVLAPYLNRPSITLHEKFGFKAVLRTSGTEGFVSGCYLKQL